MSSAAAVLPREPCRSPDDFLWHPDGILAPLVLPAGRLAGTALANCVRGATNEASVSEPSLRNRVTVLAAAIDDHRCEPARGHAGALFIDAARRRSASLLDELPTLESVCGFTFRHAACLLIRRRWHQFRNVKDLSCWR